MFCLEMIFKRRESCSKDNRNCLLLDALGWDELSEVCSFLSGDYRFIAAVNRTFRELAKTSSDGSCRTDVNKIISVDCMKIYHGEGAGGRFDRWHVSRIGSRTGSIPLLQWSGVRDALSCAEAAGNGHLRALAWLRSAHCPWDWRTCARAAGGGHTAVLKYAAAQGCPRDASACSYAALGGHAGTLERAVLDGFPWDERTCANAALRGHAGVLEWARGRGCPWDDLTCTYAAAGGHLEILKWALENSCPYESERIRKSRHSHILEWFCSYERKIQT